MLAVAKTTLVTSHKPGTALAMVSEA